jgi:two-component system, cell cycle response regulator DivK
MHDPSVAEWAVLVIDDDPDNLAVASQYLSFLGANVRTAVNAETGLAALDDFKPTFILLDLSMPKVDGWEMFKLIRKRSDSVSTPVIALTAHAMLGDQEKVLGAGFNGYITKPFLLPTLLDDIKRCLGQS